MIPLQLRITRNEASNSCYSLPFEVESDSVKNCKMPETLG